MTGGQASGSSPPTSVNVGLAVILAIIVILGGSIRNAFIATAILEILACLALIWCLLDTRLQSLTPAGVWLFALILSGGLICLLQLVPIPHLWWTALPGREEVAEVFKSSGLGAIDQPVSLAPDRTLQGVLRLLPPLAVFVIIAKLAPTIPAAHVAWTVVILAAVSAILGIVQAFAGDFPFLFPYGEHNYAQAPGLFEVVGHQAALQVIAIPFVFLLFANLKSNFEKGDASQALGILSLVAFLIAMAAVFLSGSAAGYALAISVVLASFGLMAEREPGLMTIAVTGVAVLGIAALAYVCLTNLTPRSWGLADFGEGGPSRQALFSGTMKMVRDYWPVGAGLGAFEVAYPAYENLAAVSPLHVSHAHNDYLEIAAELGLPGCLVLAGVVIWSGVMTFQAWRAPQDRGGRLKRAASIALGAVLAHSLLDSPARTEAISCLAALCVGIMSSNYSRRGAIGADAADRRAFKHRHLEI